MLGPSRLGRGRQLALLLGPLRGLLFFRRQGRFLLLVLLIFEFFGHGVRSIDLQGVFLGNSGMPPSRRLSGMSIQH